MENLPAYISIVFVLATLLTALLFFKATGNKPVIIFVTILWLTLQALIAGKGFYTVTDTIPPHFILAVFPPLILIIFLFGSSKGRKFLDITNQKTLTLIHIVRIPVELVLLWLSIHKLVPSIMTFEGRNLDIFSGITAPLVYYFAFVQDRLGRTGMLVWNFICLALLINIVIIAILSAPFVFQKLAFDQPNIAILYFPFIWLPCFIVPVILFAHLTEIRRLMRSKLLAAAA
ncbi:MAG: hypothetical protein ACJ749_04275 [Flavisolibacter sp.]